MPMAIGNIKYGNLKSILFFGGSHYWIKVKIDNKWIKINDIARNLIAKFAAS